jgi:hypothetical protein
MSKRRQVTAPANSTAPVFEVPSPEEEEETQEEGTEETGAEEEEETMPEADAAEQPAQAPEPAEGKQSEPETVAVPVETLQSLLDELRELKGKVKQVEQVQEANRAAAELSASPVAPPVETVIHAASETGAGMDVKTLNLPVMFAFEKVRVGPGEVKINVADPEGKRMHDSLVKAAHRANRREQVREERIRAQGATPQTVPIHFAITDPEQIARMTVKPDDEKTAGRVGL